MKRFKVGDHVRGAVGSQGYYTQPGELLEAVVTALSPDGDIRIKVLKHTTHPELIEKEFEATVQELELL